MEAIEQPSTMEAIEQPSISYDSPTHPLRPPSCEGNRASPNKYLVYPVVFSTSLHVFSLSLGAV